MNVDDLNLFAEAASKGSFAAVARDRNVDPSRISRAISGLEAELGCLLFTRTTRKCSLTDAGETYLRRIAPLLEELREAQDEIRAKTSNPIGTLRITSSAAYSQHKLLPVLANFRKEYPGIALDLAISDAVLDMREERIDLALRLAPALSGEMISTKLHATSYKVCAAPTYLQNSHQPETPEDLVAHDAVVLNLAPFDSKWRYRGKSTEGEISVEGKIHVSTPLAQVDLMLAGHGVALVADWIVRQAIEEKTCVDLFPDLEFTATDFDTAVWLIYPERRFLPAKTRVMIDFLKRSLSG